MRIGIISDTHSCYRTVETAVAMLRQQKVACVLHCGDIEDADTVFLFHDLPTHFVLGNCDHDRVAIHRAVQLIGATLHEPFGDLELAGRKIAFLHGDDMRLLHDLEQSGHFDFIFHGHTHEAEDRRSRRGPTRIINPGALHRAEPKTFAVLDLASGAAEWIEVG